MSEARFIEGPWQLGEVVKLDGRTGDYQRITDGGGMGANIIAHVCVAHPANFELAESGRANAHLIVAAPDLLEALRELKQLMDMVLAVTGGLPPDANGPAAKALAAIRKATGVAA